MVERMPVVTGASCFVPVHRGMLSISHHWVACRQFSINALYHIRKFPSTASLLIAFIIRGIGWILSDAFPTSIEMIVWVFPLFC